MRAHVSKTSSMPLSSPLAQHGIELWLSCSLDWRLAGAMELASAADDPGFDALLEGRRLLLRGREGEAVAYET